MIKNKKGAISLILIVLFVVLAGLGGYAYYTGNKVNPKSSIAEKLTGGFTKVVESITPEVKSEELNYSFNVEANFEALEDSKIKASGELKIKDGELITLEKSLKQRLKIGEVSGKVTEVRTGTGETKTFVIKDFDSLAEDEMTYFYVGEGYEQIIPFYKMIAESNPLLKIETVNLIEKTLKEKKYLKIDNSEPVLRILGKLKENELIKKLAIGLVTSNPKAYYEKVGAGKELKEFFASDLLINYLFKEGNYNEETKKTTLAINNQICKDISPIIFNIAKEVGQEEKVNAKNIERECIIGIKQANGILPMIMQMYKEGDTKIGDYKFVIVQGGMFNLEIDYKKHILNTWKIDLKAPNEMLVLNLSGDKNKLKSSLLKLNIEKNGIKINGEIKNGNGKINIDGKVEGIFETKGFISFSNYKPSYDLLVESGLAKSKIIAKGDYKSGKINVKVQEKEFGLLEYSKEKIKVNIDAPEIKGKINYENKTFDADFDIENKAKYTIHLEKNKINLYATPNIEEKYSFDYNNGKVDGNMKNMYIDAIIKGEFRKMGDFDFEFNEKNEKINVTLKAEEKGENKNECNLVVKKDGKEEFNMNIIRKTGNKDGYKTCELKAKAIVIEEKKELNFNINTSYKKGGAKFEIPKNIEEIKINLAEISTLPDFNSLARLREMGLDNTLVGITAGAVIGTAGFIGLQSYNKGMRDSYNISNERSIEDFKGLNDEKNVKPKVEVISPEKQADMIKKMTPEQQKQIKEVMN